MLKEKEKKEEGKKEKRENRGGFLKERFVRSCTVPLRFSWGKALRESKDRLSIKDLGLDLKIWQEHINV